MSKYPTLEEARKSLKIRWYRTKLDTAVPSIEWLEALHKDDPDLARRSAW
jgi:hypothetical protein